MSLKKILNCCKLEIVFKSKTRIGNNFHFKDQIPKDLTSGVAYKFQCGLCNKPNYCECVRHLNWKIGEHIGIAITTYQKTSNPKNSSVINHLLFCNQSAFCDNFSILKTKSKNKKFSLKLNVSLLIMRDKLSLIRNTTSTPLYLFDTP